MNLAVKFYSENNTQGIPDFWPEQVIELGNSNTLPSDDYQLFTLEEYNSYLETNKHLYDEWLSSQENSMKILEDKMDIYIQFGEGLVKEMKRKIGARNIVSNVDQTTVYNVTVQFDTIKKLLEGGGIKTAKSQLQNILPNFPQYSIELGYAINKITQFLGD